MQANRSLAAATEAKLISRKQGAQF